MGRARQRGPVLGCRGKQSENKLVRDKPGNPIQDHVTWRYEKFLTLPNIRCNPTGVRVW
jgi:hypothetical protein